MNGSAPPTTITFERGTTAAEICVFIPQEAGVTILVQSAAPLPAVASEAPDRAPEAGVAWRRRAGGTPVVHAFAVNSCVDVPLCGACLGSGRFEELPAPPANLGPYRRCRKCLAAVGRLG